MKEIKEYLCNEELNVSKSFILNMKEIDYDTLIEFIKDMQSKNVKLIQFSIDSNRKWKGCELSSDGKHKYNCTDLN